MEKKMFCSNCGKENTVDAKFCVACGNKLDRFDEASTISKDQSGSFVGLDGSQLGANRNASGKRKGKSGRGRLLAIGIALFVAGFLIFWNFLYQPHLAKKQSNNQQQETSGRQKELTSDPHPYIAMVTCGMGGDHINIMPCFTADRVETEIELRNGDKYRLYKFYEIHELGKETEHGLEIELARDFSFKAQNSHENLILGVKIVEKANPSNILFQKQVSRFGVISVRN